MFAIFKKELRSFFLTPTGYIFMSLFLLLTGIFFVTGNLFALNSNLNSGFISSAMFIFMLVSPVLTMKLLSDEQRFKTDQLLLTSPVRIIDIVLGKYLAAMAFFGITLSITLLYAVIIGFYGDLIISETIGGYLGFLLMGAVFVSIGLFISGTTENQVVAAIVTFAVLLLMWLTEMIVGSLPTNQTAGLVFASVLASAITAWLYLSTRNIIIGVSVFLAAAAGIGLSFALKPGLYVGFIAKVMNWFSVLSRFPDFAKGYIRFSDLIYYLTLSGLFVFLTVRVIEKRRWS